MAKQESTKTKNVVKPDQKEPDLLYLSLQTIWDLKSGEIKLEMDFSPPFEMLHADFEPAAGRFASQGSPCYFDIDRLQQLFSYITETLPLAITKISRIKAVINTDTIVASQRTNASRGSVFGYKEKEFSKLLSSAKKTRETISGQLVRSNVVDALRELQINRIFVDPERRNSLIVSQATSGTGGSGGSGTGSGGGDVPPPKVPPPNS